MDAKPNETLTQRLKRSLKERKVSVPEFEAQTGIPKDRVYKWLKRATDNIGYEDAASVEKWLNNCVDNSPKQEPLEMAVYNLTETERMNAESIQRLIRLLEIKMLPQDDPHNLKVGNAGIIPLEGKKQKG